MGNIHKALAAINKGVTAIGKNQKNQQQGFKFRGIDDVMNSLHGLFAENNVIILPEVKKCEQTSYQTAKGGNMYRTLADITFHFIADDGSEVATQITGEAMDSGDKGMNKAMSIALKYSLFQMFLIPTEEMTDPDATTPEETYNTIPEPQMSREEELRLALEKIKTCNNRQECTAVWNTYQKAQGMPEFTDAIKARLKEIQPK